MKKKAGLLVFFISVLIFKSFGQTADITEGCVPLEVQFEAPEASSQYYWDFKDGVTSDQQNPVNIFSRPGVYNVTFRQTAGGPVVGTVEITVYEEPQLDVAVSPFPGCVPLNAEFTNLSQVDPAIVVTDYVWVFGDGHRSEGVENPTHLYTSTGKYNISFSIKTNHETCNKTEIFNEAVEVISRPVASYSTTPSIPFSCDDTLEVAFHNNSSGVLPLSYSWDLGNDVGTNLENPPLQEYTIGQYSASLTVTYPGIPGCSSTRTRTISVGSPKPDIILNRDTVCLEDTITFRTTVPGRYNWNYGPNGHSEDSTSNAPIVSFSAPGYQTVTLTTTSFDGRCSGTITADIYVQELIAEIESDPGFVCESPERITYTAVTNDEDVTYSWNFSPETDYDAEYSTQVVEKLFKSKTDTIYFSENGFEKITARLYVTSNRSGCSAFTSTSDTMWLPNARFMPDVTKGCGPLDVVFYDSSKSSDKIVNWKWVFDDGTTLSNADSMPVFHTYSDTGEYMAQLIVTTETGCVDSSYAILIEVGGKHDTEVDFTADRTEVCLCDPVTFSTIASSSTKGFIDAYHFTTEGNRSFHCSDEDELTWTYCDEVGPQDVTLTLDHNGCYTRIHKPAMMNVKGAVAKLDYTAYCDNPLNYTFESKSINATSVTWYFGDGNSEVGDSVSHTYANPGVYSVQLIAENADGCIPNSEVVTIYPSEIKAKITLPDTLLCVNNAYTFNANESEDVHGSCYTGYTWQFPTMDKRPHTSGSASANFRFTPNQAESTKLHTARLIVKDINGCKDTATATFRVFDMNLDMTASDYSICTPNTVEFTDGSTSDTTLHKWEWNFGDNSSSTEQNPSHTYLKGPFNNQTHYSVQLRVWDTLGCVETRNFIIQHYIPESNITASKTNLCLGDSVSFSASDFTQQGSYLNFDWDFGNGMTSTSREQSILYAAAGEYTVQLFYEEEGSGCKDTATQIIRLQEYPVAGMVTNVDTLEVLCAPQNVFFEDASESSSPITFNYWNFGNGQVSAANEFSLFYDKGDYTAYHIVRTSFGCADTTSKDFRVFRPEGDFEMDKNTICKGEEITFTIKDTADVSGFTWAFGDGTVLNDEAPVVHQYNFHPESGQTIAKLVIRGFDGACPIELEQPVNIHQVIADFTRMDGIDTSICFQDGPYEFTNASVSYDSHLWEFGDGQTSAEISPTYAYAEPGVYDVRLSVAHLQSGCVDTIVKQAVIYDHPVVEAVGDTVCQGDTLQLYVVNPVSSSIYSWTPSEDVADASVPDIEAFPLHTTQYLVTETDTNGCAGTATAQAIVIEPIHLADWDTTIIVGDEIALPAVRPDLYIFHWNPEEGLSCLNCSYPKVRPLEDITYSLQVSDSLQCFSSTFEYDIIVRPETFVKLPTTFTPNGDDVNNVFLVRGWGIKELIEFQIFNRWGQMIYRSNDLQQGWDGKFQGIDQNSDVYVYKVKVLTWRDEVVYQEGFVNLLR